MAKIKTKQPSSAEGFFDRAMLYAAQALSFFIPISFFLQTYDTVQVKTTLYFMGALSILCLWLLKLINNPVKLAAKHNVVVLLPFILYFAYVCFSFIFHPYHLGRFEAFARFALGGVLFLIIWFEFDENKLNRLVSSIIWACWAVYGYGIVQILNNLFFKGLDPFFWTDFFGSRVFSTIANPNFFAGFCLFTLMIIAARFLQTKQKSLLLLGAIGLVNIFFTESKGAWLALAASAFVWILLALNFFAPVYKKHRLKLNAAAVILVFAAVAAVGYFGAKRMQSFDFRIFTWRAAVDMVKDAPVLGTGAGSFNIIYPAYKRPEIFYMENIHNAATMHAENFFLEQWAELGIIGFGLWLFAAAFWLKCAWQRFKGFDYAKASKQERATMFLAAGFFMAALSIYIHNFVDVGIYFVSTSFFLFIFLGALLRLSEPPVYELAANPAQSDTPLAQLILKGAKIISVTAAVWLAAMLLNDFFFVTTGVAKKSFLMGCAYWLVFLAVIGGGAYIFIKGALEIKKPVSCIIITAFMIIIYKCFAPFVGDYYYSLAGYFAEQNNTKTPVYYQNVIDNNPFVVEPHQFKGMFYISRLDMSRSYKPEEGDSDFLPRNDFERGLASFEDAAKISPNNALLAYHVGALYNAAAVYYMQNGDGQKAMAFFRQAEYNFNKALLTDPVFDSTYYNLANIAMKRNDYQGAAYWLRKYIAGPEGVTNPDYLARHHNDQKALGHLRQIEELIK